MAQIDPNIALSIRPAQIESPLVHAARAAELQGAQQNQFMNMLKMKEYVDESRTKNAMMKWLSGKTAKDLESDQNINELATKFGPQGLALAKQIDDRRKAQGEAEYRQAQITDLKSQGVKREYDVNKSRTEDAIKTISGFTNRQQALDMLYESEANGVIPRDAAENIRRAIPDNEEEFPAFKQSLIERLMTPNERMKYQQEQRDRNAPKWELKKVGAKEMLVDTNPYSQTVGQMKPNTEALVDTTPKWELKKIGDREVLVDTNSFSPTVGQMKPGVEALVDTTPKPEKIEQDGKISFRDMNPNSATYGQLTGVMQEIVDTEPKWVARDIGGSITYVDENRNSSTFGQQKEGAALTKTALPAAVTESPLAKLVREREALPKDSPLLKRYDEAIDKETGGAPPALVQEYLYAQKNNGFKGTLLEFKERVAAAGRNVTNNPAPVQTVTVQGPNGPEMRDARTGRLITDDKGQALKPYDASNKPLSPAQQQKLKKDRLADDAKITSAKDMADDIEKNVDALLGNEKKKIKPHPGLSGITGYNAMLPSLPGGQPRAAQQLLDSVKGKVTQVGKSLASQEGKLGNMAVQEWKIVADAVERIDPAAPNFANQLRSVVSQARRLETNLKSRRDAAYAADQPASQNSVFSEADAIIGR